MLASMEEHAIDTSQSRPIWTAPTMRTASGYKLLVGAGLASLLAASPVHADEPEITIVTHSGETVHGRLVSETERGFLVALPDRSVLVEYAQVKQVARGTLAPSGEASGGKLDIGLGVAALWGPTISERSEDRFFVVGPVIQAPIELPGERLRLRFTPMLTLGFVGGSGVWRRFGEIAVDAQLRVHASAAVSFGLGLFAGFGVSTNGIGGCSDGLAAYGVIGPSLTLFDLRLGEAHQHEIQLWSGLHVQFGGTSGIDMVRVTLGYAYHF
jgi:hypothetical protein